MLSLVRSQLFWIPGFVIGDLFSCLHVGPGWQAVIGMEPQSLPGLLMTGEAMAAVATPPNAAMASHCTPGLLQEIESVDQTL